MTAHATEWADIISQVERANLNQETHLKQRQKQISKNYLDQLDREVVRHHEQLQQKNRNKVHERKLVEAQAEREKQGKIEEKRHQVNRELYYKNKNMELIEHMKNSAVKEPLYGEHPFIRLVDGEEQRRQAYRQKLKKQNEINSMQERIKLQQRRENSQTDRQYRSNFINHVEKFYEKKQMDRNLFKQRYLRLTNPEKQDLMNSRMRPDSDSVEKEYESFLNHQVEQQSMKKQSKDRVDDVLMQINKSIEYPDSSPAFIGRNPINHDRRKQLEYLDRSSGNRSGVTLTRRLKTEEDVVDRKRHPSQIEDLKILQKYFAGTITKTMDMEKQSHVKDPFINKPQYSPEISKLKNTKALQSSKQVVSNRQRMKTELSVGPKKQAKSFLSFDIIQQRQKLIYL